MAGERQMAGGKACAGSGIRGRRTACVGRENEGGRPCAGSSKWREKGAAGERQVEGERRSRGAADGAMTVYVGKSEGG